MISQGQAISFFGECNPKYLSRFSEKTPEGNYIKGWICRATNRYHGSLLIDEFNGMEHNQFVQSMPKINYFDNEMNINLEDYYAVAYEKLDGSCLIVYPLLDENGNLMEIIPKTRGRAVADRNFQKLYKKIDKSSIYKYYRHNHGILFFELYGILNQHEILHYDTGIDIKLIGVYDYKHSFQFDDYMEVDEIAEEYGFKQPEKLFLLRKASLRNCYKIDIRPIGKYSYYLEDVPVDDLYVDTKAEAVLQIKTMLDYLNKLYNDWYGRDAIEGVVLNCFDTDYNQKYIKIKSSEIEKRHRNEQGIPRTDINKEVLKYFDDYGSEVKEIYDENPEHHTEYLYRMLGEDYSDQQIQESKDKIEKIFMQVWDSQCVPESIHNICEELINDYGEQGITDCMRMFAQKYPMKKKDAKTVYNVLEKKFHRKGLKL